ncbi:variant surface glycoprotein (VSG, atypical), putative [Trypanosoma brucei brucei TREU927]|uniref:Variant surface glycoprotein (VSG, atypical), putative n=1 Tax=Trypanosoma brucei brucei (strain 927/4 GUTat10.1) TaxID=185431 RepID=Q38CU1_TRYB2|nr:variant surface glycoprotein [Trypanosoma brucei brucei TREU927]EAN77379.1 variant surface glycoprotein (VSG, atypical), putative [Trypanosoma brucei brucei TREU927]
MQGTMYWVVFLVAVLQGIHLVSGQDIVNQQEFEALCRMINWAERGLKHIKLAKQVTEEALSIGIRYLEVADADSAAQLGAAEHDACMDKREVREKNCGLYKTFWEESQRLLKEKHERSQAHHRGRNSLQYHTAEEIKSKVMEVADIFHEVKWELLELKVNNMEEQLNQALYGRTYSAEEIREREERSRVCGQSSRSEMIIGGQSLVMDLLCLCAMHSSWKEMRVCCADCTTGENGNTWNPGSNGAPRWKFLKQKCAGATTSYVSVRKTLRGAKQDFMDAVTEISANRRTNLYKLGEKQNKEIKDCGADKNSKEGICVFYRERDGVVFWMKALENVDNKMEVLLQDRTKKTSKLERIKELSQEIESLIKGDTGRGRQQGRQKRSVDTENSVPETPADPSDPTQSTTHTNEKKRIVRKPISTGNNASKSYGGDEVDSYDSKCDGENSACSDSPAKPTVKSSKSAINCPLGLILLLV